MPTVSVPLRLLRAALFAAVCVVLSVAGHAAAGPDPVPGWAVLVALLAGVTVGLAGGARECSLRRVCAGMLLGQAALHQWFSWAATTPPTHPAHHHAAGYAMDDGHHAGHHDARMLLAHGVVAVAAAVWLRAGEAAVFGLLARADARTRAGLRALVRLLGAASPAPRPRPTVRRAAHRRPPRLLTRFDVARRGPPVAVVV
ncbi:hypothetical protein [Yinghuangia seranimata]|uniref:hypothetical protein n=1 Tax=Yinghuangia seranimata TaxID=408067 RepID=UPI00248BA255|nr:hypothetical protein [Yinghuangia seranimata]MDI2128414.1 hypothetical protein [Yinghuangia seranimata]